MSVFLKCIKLAAFIIFAVAAPFSLAVEPLKVQGNQILAGGEQTSFAGMSLFWSNNGWGGEKFYNASSVTHMQQDMGATIVRAAMGVEDPGGYFTDATGNETKVRQVIDAALANDMYVIVDWHSHHAHEHDWGIAIDFFQRIASDYGHHNNIIYEVYNEPLQVPWADIKAYATAVAQAIRQVDPDNLIIVGTPQWSQKVHEASYDPLSVSNVAYTLHFYAGTHGQFLRDWATEAMNNGIALFATEWGTVNANGDGGVAHASTDQWMDFLKQHNISHANWSYNDKVEGASALFPDGGYTESGLKVKNIITAWDSTLPGGGECRVINIPAKIQAENYCSMVGVQTENTSDTGGGLNVGWIDTGDWMSFDINTPSTNRYKVSYRVAALDAQTALQLEAKAGAPVYGYADIAPTGGWQNWTTISHEVDLTAGEQSIAIRALGSGWNINWFEITEACTGADCCEVDCGGESIFIEAENYTYESGTALENTADEGGGQNVGWLDAGDWLSYHNINIPASGTYKVEFRVSAHYGGGIIQLEKAGGSEVYATVSVPNTGGWQNWTTITADVTLQAGVQNLGIAIPSAGYNLNWIKLTLL